jgi:hypothetical protein
MDVCNWWITGLCHFLLMEPSHSLSIIYFQPSTLFFKNIKWGLWDHLAVYVSPINSWKPEIILFVQGWGEPPPTVGRVVFYAVRVVLKNRWFFYFSGFSQSHVTTDDQSVSPSWCRGPCGSHDRILIPVWHLRFCLCRAPPLTRGRVCHLYLLVTLTASVH